MEISQDTLPGGDRQRVVLESGIVYEPGSGRRVVEVNTPSSPALRELVSYRRDIELTQMFIDTLIERGVEKLEVGPTPDLALWFAAITTYGRAFGTGVRTSEKLSLEAYTDEERDWHEYFMNVRNKHVAHAVNDSEQVLVLAFLSDSSFAPRRIEQVGQAHAEVIPSDRDEAAQLSALCKKQLADIKKRANRLRQSIAGELAAMNIGDLYALPTLVTPKYDVARVAKRRKR